VTGQDGATTPYWAGPPDRVLADLGSSSRGITAEEAERRLAEAPAAPGRRTADWWRVLVDQFASPIILILLAATVISMLVGDLVDGSIIVAIIVASALLGFVQDFRAGRDIAALLARVQVEATVVRDGHEVAVPVAQVVVGDVVVLAAGSVIPADCRLLEADELLVDESSLTGESFPVEKRADAEVAPEAPLSERIDAVLFGTHVLSGTGRAVVARVGRTTELGTITRDLRAAVPRTAYEKGITRFGYLLVRVMLVLTVLIFVANTALGRPVVDSMLFSLALAVGLTPQMLPAIVTISLSSGARRMAKRRVIVKRLDVIEDLGSMTVLCTDKTGTLTIGAPGLDRALDPTGAESSRVLDLAVLNAGLQEGFANPMDAAILERQPLPDGAVSLGQVPYDFRRKRVSVLAEVDGTRTLVVKGALPSVLGACTTVADGSGSRTLDAAAHDAVTAQFEQLSAGGYRVLAVADRPYAGPGGTALTPEDERDLRLVGLLAFHDAVKDSAARAVSDLRAVGISLRLITGDHALAARATATNVGLETSTILTGPEIEALDDSALARSVAEVSVFAEVEPHHKRRIVQALRTSGSAVGFLGDGINDAPALHAADVGISVDTAVDVAREAAAVVLLGKDLEVVIDGVRLGRETFANTLKYTRLTISANFGNMISMAMASVVLPFLPLLPRQILLLNFLSDVPSTAIAGDAVDSEQSERPASWDIAAIRRFMVVFGIVSTAFDLLTFAVLIWLLDATATEFRSAWFIESTISELLVLFSLRTNRPMFTSRPGTLLLTLSVVVGAVVIGIPFVPPVADVLGLDRPGAELLLAIVAITVTYVATNELVKWFVLGRHSRRPSSRTSVSADATASTGL
jgi:Mg2+-importing ATPase